MTKILVIIGTARDDSNTLRILKQNLPFKEFDLVELHKKSIEKYRYENQPEDDFLSIAKQMTLAEIIVFATPVYWYSMSGVMKVFFDRLTDLITTSKQLGRLLAKKKVYLFSTGTEADLPEGFEVPFRRTCEYFEMHFEKAFYFCVEK